MQEGAVLSDNYRLERLLGRGGMADVYLAFDIRRQARVAIKVLREDLADDPEFVRRFSREAAALARLEHPNIVRFYAFEQAGALAFIVMDYVQGTNLQRRLMEAQGPLPLEELTDILHRVGSALQYAHREGYVHRDIKPGNVMLREDGTPLLSDFGIARVAESATASTVALGTPAYMSPEQILGHELDRRTDIYSLGIVLYEMATGRRPFTGDERGLTGTGTLARLREAHLRLAPPHPQAVNPALPTGAAEVIVRAMAKDPAQRWPDVLSLVQAWETAVGLKGAESPRPGVLPLPGRVGPTTPTPIRPLLPTDKAAPPTGARVVTSTRGANIAQPAEPPRAVSQHPGRKGTPWLAFGALLGIVILLLVLWQVVLPAISSTAKKPTIPAPTTGAGGTAVALASAYGTATADSQATAQAATQKAALSATEQARATTAAAAPWLTVTAQWEVATVQAQATAGAISADRATITAIAVAAQETPRAAAATAEAGRQAQQAATTTAEAQVKAQATAAAQATAKTLPTPTPKPVSPAQPGVVMDFESDLTWRRGDQPYGQLDRSAEQMHGGSYAGRLRYDFPAVTANYVVFLPQPPLSLPGQPMGLTAWVYGDGAGHFLNAWIQDAAGEVRSYSFGQIKHRGWAQMTAWFDESRGWPNGHISGPDDGKLTYPASLYALVLDGVPDGQASSGVIYLDDVATTQQPIGQGTPAAPGALPAPATPAAGVTVAPAPAAGLSGRIAYSVWDASRNLYLLMVRNADGVSPQVVYEGATAPDFCRTPTNRIIAKGAKPGVEGTVVIELGGGSREAAPNTKDKLPACSPDGQRVVFETNRETEGMQIWIHGDINVHNDAGSYKLGPKYFGHYPTWSSRWQIIWQGCDYWASGGNCGIWQLPDNGQGTPVRVSSGGSDTAPDASSDGGTVAYMSRESGHWQVMAASADGGGGRQLTSEGDNGLPTWSPDGRSIAFVSNRDGGWGLWAMNADGSNQRKLAALEAGFGRGSLDWTQQRVSWGG